MIVDVKGDSTDSLNEKMTNNEVVIYESGNPVLKVETGTTLKVLKLLYESQNEKKKGQILGVRPKSLQEGIPCIVTLNESKLNELSYEILVSDESEDDKRNDSDSENNFTTTRCMDCSRESWKTKRFTSIGMNTELSVNPTSEVDELPAAEKQPQVNHAGQTRNGSMAFSPTSPPLTTESAHENSHKDVPIPPALVPNGKHHDGDYMKSHKNTSPAFEVEPYSKRVNGRHGREALHFDHFPSSHVWTVGRSRYHMRPFEQHPIVNGHSPPRSRSPLSPRHMDLREAYASQYHNIREKHLLMMHNPRHDHHLRVEHLPSTHFERLEEQHREKLFKKESERELPPTLPEYRREEKHSRHQPAEEPPVFVLPNDYDVISGVDPRLASLQDRRLAKSPPSMPNGELKHRVEQNNVKEDKKYENPSPTSGDSNEGSDPPVNTGQKLFCKICNSVFPTKSLLYKHLRGHTSDEKPFKCSECGQGFTLSSNLRQHRIIHRGYKPFQCEFCGKKFMRSNVYKQHRRIHTGEEMHKCTLCPSEFLQKYALLKHMKKNHDIDAVDN